MTRRLLPTFLLTLLTVPDGMAGQVETLLSIDSKLDKHDQALPNGEWADIYTVDLSVGDRVMVEMNSRKVDSYLVLRGPDGTVYEDDDEGAGQNAALDVFIETSGTWMVYATSRAAADKGRYQLTVKADRSGSHQAEEPESSVEALTAGQPLSASLGAGDFVLPNGEWSDRYSVSIQAGQRVVVGMVSEDIDTYIVAQAPSGSSEGNDDCDGDRARSCLDFIAQESGDWLFYATSYQAEDDGTYTLQVDVGMPEPDPETTASDTQRWSGALAAGDTTIDSGEYIDAYAVSGAAGERWVVDLRSTEFDPFLIVRAPDLTQEQNDDFDGDRTRSLLDLTLSQTGDYGIAVTTYRAGESGRYDLTLRRVTADGEVIGSAIQHTGTLGADDDQLTNGEWYDDYSFQGLPGQTVHVDLQGDFDTYVGLVGPSGFRLENDDHGESSHSRVDGVLTEAGEYTAIVTSYEAGQGGSYTLNITMDEGRDDLHSESRDISDLGTDGVHASGVLEAGDALLDSGEYQDRYVFDAQAGQALSVSMRSTDFDPYVGLHFPDGSGVENDDWEGDRDLSRIDLIAPETGRYRVIATSYRAGETGSYTLDASVGAVAEAPSVETVVSATGGQIYGVFVGISEYPADGPTDLDYTADDAQNLYEGMKMVGMAEGNGHLLTDSEATRDNVLAAIRQVSSEMTEDDLLMVFYSGHGGRQQTSDSQSADPDGYDETLALYDVELTDDELSGVFDEIEHGKILLVLDSCFSGGFSKDVINRPGRMGLFSSQEDVTSAVARKFRAGGYLSRFMVEAVGERMADYDDNGSLTALELSQYVHERYRSDVKSDLTSKGSGVYDDIVMVGRNLGYQHLVVDRGGVAPSAVLFAW